MIEEVGSVSKFGLQILHRLNTHGGYVYGYVRNLEKTSNLPVPKVRQFSFSKPSYTKQTMARHRFKKIRPFVKFKIDICYKDQTHV